MEIALSPILAKILWPTPASIILCEHEGKIIVLDTGSSYRFPGGIMKSHEHPEETAEREFYEETGLECNIQELVDIKTCFNGVTGLHLFYSAELESSFDSCSKSWEGKPILVEKNKLPEEMKEIVTR